MPKRVFPAKYVRSGGLDNILLHLGGQTLKQQQFAFVMLLTLYKSTLIHSYC